MRLLCGRPDNDTPRVVGHEGRTNKELVVSIELCAQEYAPLVFFGVGGALRKQHKKSQQQPVQRCLSSQVNKNKNNGDT